MSRISDQTVDGYLDAVSARRSTPGGGAVAAIVAAEGCALLEMVLNFTQSEDARLTGMAARLGQTRPELLAMADRDMAAFEQVMQAYRGDGDLEEALVRAAETPLAIIAICRTLSADAVLLGEIGNRNLITDVAIAASLLITALESSEINVLVNTRAMQQERAATEARLGDSHELKQTLSALVADIRNGLT